MIKNCFENRNHLWTMYALMTNELERKAIVAGIHFINLNVQIHAKGIYTALGYAEVGKILEEAGNLHLHMKKS